eukprot:scaffold4170_cov330-Prasinococcus_capsulatus_cf.AAC.6
MASPTTDVAPQANGSGARSASIDAQAAARLLTPRPVLVCLDCRTPAQFLAEMRATTMHSNGNGTTPTDGYTEICRSSPLLRALAEDNSDPLQPNDGWVGASSGYFSGLMGSGDSAGLSEIGNEDASNGPRLISEASIVNRMYAGAMMQSRNSSDELKSSLCSEDAGATQEMDAIVVR